MTEQLTTTDHNRNIAGLKYVYPVMSRRAGGLSIGINVNTNNACNWRCLYCQVPDLSLGAAPDINFTRLEEELRWFLHYVLEGEFYERFEVPMAQRNIKDIAISGNGEPTSVKGFSDLILRLTDIINDLQLAERINKVLITNGSLISRADVQKGLKAWAELRGEVWFKLDSATLEGRKLLNNAHLSNQHVLRNLRLASEMGNTKIQTCLLHYSGGVWPATEREAYLSFLSQVTDLPNLRTVLLYTLARPSYQPEAPLLSAMPLAEMQEVAADLQKLGFNVSVSV